MQQHKFVFYVSSRTESTFMLFTFADKEYKLTVGKVIFKKHPCSKFVRKTFNKQIEMECIQNCAMFVPGKQTKFEFKLTIFLL